MTYITALVLRVWLHNLQETDTIVSTWGVNLSGLVYLGNKTADIQQAFFGPNAVIFCMKGGFFTSYNVIKCDDLKSPPFIHNVNVDNSENIFKRTCVSRIKSEVRDSYNIEKLRKLHSLQVTIKNKSLDVQSLKENIQMKCGSDGLDSQILSDSTSNSSPNVNIRYAPQLLTMKSVNKMLQVRVDS